MKGGRQLSVTSCRNENHDSDSDGSFIEDVDGAEGCRAEHYCLMVRVGDFFATSGSYSSYWPLTAATPAVACGEYGEYRQFVGGGGWSGDVLDVGGVERNRESM